MNALSQAPRVPVENLHLPHGGRLNMQAPGAVLFRVSAMLMFRLLRILCLVLALTTCAMARPLVVIDAGHGGHDRGGMPGQKIPEKGYTLDVAKRLDAVLRAAGYRTIMTRSSDVFVGLGDRCRIANAQRNAIFVSVHFNGATNYDAYGIETYYYSGSRSAKIASAVHRSLLSATGTMDRRVRTRGFFVIRRTSIPAILCELGFLTNKAEARKIDTASYRQRLAEGIARGIRACY
jgi:N-acetylmuramoyl-L-alanine amidase